MCLLNCGSSCTHLINFPRAEELFRGTTRCAGEYIYIYIHLTHTARPAQPGSRKRLSGRSATFTSEAFCFRRCRCTKANRVWLGSDIKMPDLEKVVGGAKSIASTMFPKLALQCLTTMGHGSVSQFFFSYYPQYPPHDTYGRSATPLQLY